MKPIYVILATGILLMGCSNEIADIEASNKYAWQKFMNEDEYNEIKIGMSYIEVVRIAGGEGEWVHESIYEWPDEQLMTQAYELEFEDNKLVNKKIIEKHGHSTR